MSFVPNCFIFERKAKLCWAGTQKLRIRTFLWKEKGLEGCRHFFSLFPGQPSSSGCPLCRRAPTELKACSAERDGQRAWGRNPETCWLPRGNDWGNAALSFTGLIWRPWAADTQLTTNLLSWWPRGCCDQEGQHLGWAFGRDSQPRGPRNPNCSVYLSYVLLRYQIPFPCSHQLGDLETPAYLQLTRNKQKLWIKSNRSWTGRRVGLRNYIPTNCHFSMEINFIRKLLSTP